MKFKFFCFLTLSIFFGVGLLQAQHLIKVKEFESKNNFVETDPLGFIYSVDEQEIIKLDAKGKILSRFSTRNFGKISSADVSNPLKIVLFFKDFSAMLILDNMLNPSGDIITLENLGIPRAGMVCRAFDNGFWIFDTDKIQLQRFSNNNEIVSSSGNLNQLISNPIKLKDMKEANNKVYLLNQDSCLFEFDIFGTYLKTLKLKENQKIQIKENKILTWNSNKIYVLDEKSLFEQEIDFLEFSIKSISFFYNQLIISDGKKICIYNIL
jgi:hypothetical protein